MKNGIIDFHTHILPGIDDGSRSVRQSLAMLAMQKEQGVSVVVATPHFYADRNSVEHFLEKREEAYQKLTEAMQEQGIETPTLRYGAEVYFFGGIGKAEMLPKLCINDTNLVLIEMPFCQWTKDMLSEIRWIIEKQKLQVVLAHIDRYYEFQKDKSVWNAMFELPIYAQINGGSFLNWKKKRKCLGYLKEDWDVILGSDCHNTESRVPNLLEARAYIEKKLGEERLQEIDSLGERILLGYDA